MNKLKTGFKAAHKYVDSMITIDSEDIIIWSDCYWCYRYELEEHPHRSDDYRVIYYNDSSTRELYKYYTEGY